MTRDDITRMAREAGVLSGYESELFQRFAALVAAAERERIIAANAPEIERINAYIKELEAAAIEEREACAELCERMARRTDDIRSAALEMAAENIRTRGKT